MIFGVGIDLVEVARIEESLQRFDERFQERVFTPAERDYCNAQPHPAINYAARFAAKEAFLKAIGCGLANGMSWTDVSVEKTDAGRPVLRVTGRGRQLADKLGIAQMHVSLSHTRDHATAVVILEKA